ncbi:MAG: MarR family transcriptional regulator [Desulfohalobiaceae bacterium]|nr:MarR family transcriptional regulator [Desulfohalobiaceae bacterium]
MNWAARDAILETSKFYRFLRTSMRMKTSLYRVLHAHGLEITPEQWSVLSCLWEKEGQYSTEIAEKTGRDKHTISRIINLLLKKGIVRRQRDPQDKRRAHLYLTEKGRRLERPVNTVVEDFCAEVFHGVSEIEADRLQQIQERLLQNIKRLRGI